MSVHVPSLPSSVAWETPLHVSRDVLGALSSAADSAAETAVHLMHPRRSTSPVQSAMTSKWTMIVLAAVVALFVVSIVRRSRVEEHAVNDRAADDRTRPAAGSSD